MEGNLDFLNCLRSLDTDDSCVTIVENERQHGRMRVGHVAVKSGMPHVVSCGLLGEWQLEHRSRGLGTDHQRAHRDDRLRKALAAKKASTEVKVKRRVIDPEKQYVQERDSQAKRALGRKRPRAEAEIDRAAFRRDWRETADNHRDKVRINSRYKRQRQELELDRMMHLTQPTGEPGPLPPCDVDEVMDARTCSSLGSSSAPLATTVLQEWRNEQHLQGVRKMYDASLKTGCMSKMFPE